MSLEEVKAVVQSEVGAPEPQVKPRILKGIYQTPGDMRLAFSISEDRLPPGKPLDLTERCLTEMARLLHLAILDDTIAIQVLGNLRELNDNYCVALQHPTEVYPE